MPISRQAANVIWGRSGGRCYIDPAESVSRTPSGDLPIGEVAHIVGESDVGPRGDKPLPAAERNAPANLILACPNHHTEIDKHPETWPADRLRAIKQRHEDWVKRTLDDQIERQGRWRLSPPPTPAFDIPGATSVGSWGEAGLRPPPPRLLAHVLDHYVLHASAYSLGDRHLDVEIRREASLAFRLAIAAVPEVIVPAVSYLQSPLCRRVINQYKALFDCGAVRLVGDASDWEEFRENRLREYHPSSPQYHIYERMGRLGGIVPALIGTTRNSTLAVHREWRRLIVAKGADVLRPAGALSYRWGKLSSSSESMLLRLPEILGEQAFVAQNVFPLVYMGADGPTERRLAAMLSSLFFSTLLHDLMAGFLTDVPYLAPIDMEGGVFSLSVVTLLRQLKLEPELDREIRMTPPASLLALQADPRMKVLVANAVTWSPGATRV